MKSVGNNSGWFVSSILVGSERSGYDRPCNRLRFWCGVFGEQYTRSLFPHEMETVVHSSPSQAPSRENATETLQWNLFWQWIIQSNSFSKNYVCIDASNETSWESYRFRCNRISETNSLSGHRDIRRWLSKYCSEFENLRATIPIFQLQHDKKTLSNRLLLRGCLQSWIYSFMEISFRIWCVWTASYK